MYVYIIAGLADPGSLTGLSRLQVYALLASTAHRVKPAAHSGWFEFPGAGSTLHFLISKIVCFFVVVLQHSNNISVMPLW